MKFWFLTIFLINSISVYANELFIGIEPSYVKEPSYAQEDYDLNIVPLLLEYEVSDDWTLRATSVVTYHFGVISAFYDKGVEIAAPFYFDSSATKKSWFITPAFTFIRNDTSAYNSKTLAGELGYALRFDDDFVLNFGFQYGRTYFNYDTGLQNDVEHMGLKVRFGYWL